MKNNESNVRDRWNNIKHAHQSMQNKGHRRRRKIKGNARGI